MSFTAPRTAKDSAVWRVLGQQLDPIAAGRARDSVSILDIGGGTGVYAVPLAERGFRVTVIDPSPDALATLRRRAISAGVIDLVTAVPGDADSLEAGSLRADVVLLHHILEYVDDPLRTVRSAAAALEPGGLISIVVQLRAGAVLARALTGRAHEALAILADPHGRTGPADPVLRRLDSESLADLLEQAGLTERHFGGVDILTDLADSNLDAHRGGTLAELETAIASASPYREVAPNAHIIATRAER